MEEIDTLISSKLKWGKILMIYGTTWICYYWLEFKHFLCHMIFEFQVIGWEVYWTMMPIVNQPLESLGMVRYMVCYTLSWSWLDLQ